MLATLQVSISLHDILELMPKFVKFMRELLKGTKEEAVKEHVDMTEKDEMVISQALPPKLKDSGNFTISCNIGKVNIPHALCDLGSSINVIPLKTVKDLKVGEITSSNMTLTLADSVVTQPVGFYVTLLDTKGDSGGSVILGRPFLATEKAKIDVETGELILKFNKKKVVFKVYNRTPYVENLDSYYHLEEKGTKVDKGQSRSETTDVRVSLVSDVF
ncbi:uncharacterized protein LOC127095302 [Lathyrus oleraceus]|uniref:uncharacterized protein LOC127095302 n=1 Tax=Pisum sativum TaxID=3888 RepID=UPI0021CFFB3A|nr:uncharacterized protein LOC127095302 [Pisum sativum]